MRRRTDRRSRQRRTAARYFVGSLAALGVVLSSAVAIAAQDSPFWLDPEPTDSEPPEAQSLEEFFAEAPAQGMDPEQAPAESASEHSSDSAQATA
jgi:hypothetical protein